ncbi:MAG TPA: M48 family metalloprotease [Bacteroidales bacterium]|jgi:predicted Zn-dependent protease|nr:M48 family metalloprotease [Bacteroidales bacterium]HQH23971.1 M48 family metalloprotease [Bacteroidales bacterium]HQJ81301.1 M48 family metalloprotease [Bacteroidales bacterium]
MKRSAITLKAGLLFFAVLIISSCAVNPVTGKRQLMLMSEEQEIQLGFSYDPQVTATFGEYQNDRLLSFIREKTTEMGRISHRPNLQYHIKILDSPVVNAFAVPGGYIYLTRGILAQLNNEAELMGVIGHEMGHITARHSVSQQTKQQLGQLLLIGGMIASEKFARYAEQAFMGMQLLFLRFSRDNEREADALGVEYSSRISYDAHKMADFFQVLNKMNMAENHGGVPTFLSTHPDPGDRYNSVHRSSAEWQAKLDYPEYKVNQENYLRLIDGIVYGEDPRQGFVENNTFYHPELKFRFNFPGGWRYENTPAQVNMAPADGKALMIFTLASQKTLQNAADTTLAALGLTLLESKNVSVNGLQARATISRQVSQDQSGGQASNLVLSYFIQYSPVIYVFHGVSAEADFNNYFNTMESSMQTFARLTDPSKLNVKPTRLLVKRVPGTATVSATLSSLGVPQDKLQEIALLNNLELNSTIQAGRLIKVTGQ